VLSQTLPDDITFVNNTEIYSSLSQFGSFSLLKMKAFLDEVEGILLVIKSGEKSSPFPFFCEQFNPLVDFAKRKLLKFCNHTDLLISKTCCKKHSSLSNIKSLEVRDATMTYTITNKQTNKQASKQTNKQTIIKQTKSTNKTNKPTTNGNVFECHRNDCFLYPFASSSTSMLLFKS